MPGWFERDSDLYNVVITAQCVLCSRPCDSTEGATKHQIRTSVHTDTVAYACRCLKVVVDGELEVLHEQPKPATSMCSCLVSPVSMLTVEIAAD